MSRRPLCLLGLAAVTLAGCLSSSSVEPIEPDEPVSAPTSFDHSAFTGVLRDVVDERGFVDYAALTDDPSALDAYLRRLAATDPAALPEDDRLAFWLNTYNAYTLKLIVASYPVGSIRDVVQGLFIPLVNSPFDIEFVTVGGEPMTLDDVEHGIIRVEFAEPRIHFALVCAARSCPPLRAEAFAGTRLDAQLDDQARRFLHDPDKNRIPAGDAAVELSKIFDWFKSDFGGDNAALQAFLAPYFDGDVRARLERGAYDVHFIGYDWSLNDTLESP